CGEGFDLAIGVARLDGKAALTIAERDQCFGEGFELGGRVLGRLRLQPADPAHCRALCKAVAPKRERCERRSQTDEKLPAPQRVPPHGPIWLAESVASRLPRPQESRASQTTACSGFWINFLEPDFRRAVPKVNGRLERTCVGRSNGVR